MRINEVLDLKSHLYRKHGITLNQKKNIKPLLEAIHSIALQQSVINLHQRLL
ncbi:hypothetical protein BTN49_1400 [Candidatus Enterovibrio escicola]|uniref:Mobile element protein n=1 Tax=Candidatus Enterovibrio escicola TaxID=1927127 RepID=A0A2A5T3W1_9GAMM|nr:hypothetical protein BTN49_1400 [Candidatus Enterovibrio escacola]